jgi:pimeloyl-ACP methyl ester carboxylesterase
MPLLRPKRDVRTISLSDGRTLGFEDVGAADGQPVIYFHGFGSSRVIRHPDDSIAERLGVRLIAVDRPGIGASSRLPGRRMLDWPSDVAALADALDIERFDVLGWSGGGPYALACAWALPQRVRTAGVISGPAPLAGVGPIDYLIRSHRAAARAAGLATWRWARQQQRDPERHLDAAVAKMIEADRVVVGDPHVRAMMLANTDEMYRQGNRGVYDEALIISRAWGFALEEIQVPVVLWHGDDDPTVPVGMGRFLAAQVPTCRPRFYVGEGHQLFVERWEEILSALVDRSDADLVGPGTGTG